MTTENIGIFAADHDYSNLIEGFSVDLDEAKNFTFALGIISDRLKQDKLMGAGDYLHCASPEDIRRDSEFERDDLYSVEADELASDTGIPLFTESADPDYRSFTTAVLKGYERDYGSGFSEAYLDEVCTAVKEALVDKVKKEEANHSITAGTAVYLRKPDTHASELRTTPFDHARHDARKVLEASKVADKPLGELELYPMPPSKSKHEPKFWGHFKDTAASKVHFTGATQRDIKLKAAVYEAWEKFFEGE